MGQTRIAELRSPDSVPLHACLTRCKFNPQAHLASNLFLLLLVGGPLARDRLGLRRHVLAVVAPVMRGNVMELNVLDPNERVQC